MQPQRQRYGAIYVTLVVESLHYIEVTKTIVDTERHLNQVDTMSMVKVTGVYYSHCLHWNT